ncbi:Lsr2 family protein [Rhodococcus erythropolis]|uniref:histone-like nucleoid-structuring protein Lsr2 n=1 Tax=Rhodococcus erythropolis TaxID=1833 RepID=UPI001C9B08D1|nr:Lsr2 family protein [Rhodococcus erythropolis]MBY6385386.1 Lsr2 family protein [Rhodococcus erythropolis]
MAEIFIRTITDDLDGKPIDPGFEHRVTFSYQGADYQIDLRPKNADKLDAAFAPFIQSAQKLGNAKKKAATQAPAKAGFASRSPEQFQAIRDWANNNGYEVSSRGRIKKEIVEAFDASH